MEQKLRRTRQEMDALDPQSRILLEGFRPGTYIRMKFKGPLVSSPPSAVERYAEKECRASWCIIFHLSGPSSLADWMQWTPNKVACD